MSTNDLAAITFVLLFGLSGCGRTSSDPPSVSSAAVDAPPVPAGPAELALVAPITVGGALDEYVVRDVQAVHDGVVNVVCAKDRAVVRLWIALVSDDGPAPPATAGKYAVFYSIVRHADPADAEHLAKTLAAVLAKHPEVPVPNGLTKFVPAPIPI